MLKVRTNDIRSPALRGYPGLCAMMVDPLDRKIFFSEEKKQKTFECCRGLTGTVCKDAKFFGSFFQKELLANEVK
jgi:hypothetical protein